MRQQVYSLPNLIVSSSGTWRRGRGNLLTTPEIYSLRSVMIVGSGDLYIAGLAAAQTFAEYAGLQPFVFSSMQAARYVAPFVGPQPPRTPVPHWPSAVPGGGAVERPPMHSPPRGRSRWPSRHSPLAA